MYLKYYDDPSRDEYLPLLRRSLVDDSSVRESVQSIIDEVIRRGDEALREYELRFDGSRLDDFAVTQEEFDEAGKAVSQDLKDAIAVAHANIEAFHRSQMPCWRRIVPIRKVGLYVPGGTAPLFSTVLMLAIPARVAGCRSLTLATPSHGGRVNPAVLYAAKVCGVDRVLKLGGAQAIAALAYGTESIEPVDKASCRAAAR